MDIVFTSATQLAAAIRTRRVSAAEVLDAHLAQIDRHNPALNAVVTLDVERARARARAADEALARGEVRGPLARTVDDLSLVYSLIAGPDGRDTEVQPVPVEAVPDLELKDLRIAVAPTFSGLPVAAEVRAAVEHLTGQLVPLCAAVEEARLPALDFTRDLMSAGELIGMMIGAFQPGEHEQPATLAQYLVALGRRDQSMIAWEQFFDDWDALLCPPAMVTAFQHRETGSPLPVDGQNVDYRMVSAHCTLFNYTGHPAVVLPYQLDRESLPLGVQLVGKRWNESRLLAMAKALTRVTGDFRAPPGYEP